MKKNLKLAISLASFLAVHASFALRVGDAQPLPAACRSSAKPPTPQNNPFLTGPEFLDNGSMSLQNIRDYLRAIGSWLQGDANGMILDTDGVMFDFAKTVFDAAADPIMTSGVSKKPINPQVLLLIIEKEQGMLSERTRPARLADRRLTKLTGCGAPSIMRGPSGQIQCAARTLRHRFDELAACQNASTLRVWHLGTTTQTKDGIMVTPANASTGANFVYDEDAGIEWGGQREFGGVARLCKLWHTPVKQGGTGFANPPVSLTLRADNPTLTCSDPLSDSLGPPNQRNVTLSVSGGTRPYTWTVTWPTSTPGTFQVCPTANGEDAVLKPPANNPKVLGDAYIVLTCTNVADTCPPSAPVRRAITGPRYACDDSFTTNDGGCGCTSGCGPATGSTHSNTCADPDPPPFSTGCEPITCSVFKNVSCASMPLTGDLRTDTMKSQGCNPCVGVMTGTKVEVSGGVPVSKTITVVR